MKNLMLCSFVGLILAATPGVRAEGDAGIVDAGVAEAAVVDAGLPDAGTPEAVAAPAASWFDKNLSLRAFVGPGVEEIDDRGLAQYRRWVRTKLKLLSLADLKTILEKEKKFGDELIYNSWEAADWSPVSVLGVSATLCYEPVAPEENFAKVEAMIEAGATPWRVAKLHTATKTKLNAAGAAMEIAQIMETWLDSKDAKDCYNEDEKQNRIGFYCFKNWSGGTACSGGDEDKRQAICRKDLAEDRKFAEGVIHRCSTMALLVSETQQKK